MAVHTAFVNKRGGSTGGYRIQGKSVFALAVMLKVSCERSCAHARKLHVIMVILVISVISVIGLHPPQVIDSRSGEHWQVHGGTDAAGHHLSTLYDGCSSWWTQVDFDKTYFAAIPSWIPLTLPRSMPPFPA